MRNDSGIILYIFWDQGRLQEAGILDRSLDVFQPIVGANTRIRCVTVEERLQGVQLRTSVLREQLSDSETPDILGDYEY